MAKLTPKQEAFCLEYVRGKGTASDAYRAVYDCKKMKPVTVNREVFDLLNIPKITARIMELREEAAKEAVIDLKTHLNDLKDLRDRAAEAEQYSAAISAEISRGKAVGLYVEKLQADIRSRVVDFGSDDADI